MHNAHAVEMGLDLKNSKHQEQLMKHFHLVIVGSVQPGMPCTQDKLDKLEMDLQHKFQYLQKHGGIRIRDESRRKQNGQ